MIAKCAVESRSLEEIVLQLMILRRAPSRVIEMKIVQIGGLKGEVQ